MQKESNPRLTWREAIAAENARLGIKPPQNIPKMITLEVEVDRKPGFLSRELGSRIQHVSGEPNGLEKRYMAFLEQRRICGEILTWKFEAMKLKLAKATFYNVDFMVVMPDGKIELHEVKGWSEDDWRVKHKIAVEMFPEFKFVVVKWNKNTKGWEFK